MTNTMQIESIDTKSDFQVLLERAKNLIPRLRERSIEVQEIRKLPESTVLDLEESGLFKMTVPKIYGGYQLDFKQITDILTEIGRGCGSTAWVLGIVTASNWIGNVLFTEQAQKEVFNSEANGRCCAILDARKAIVEKVKGGYLIKEGIWAFGSGSWHVDHIILGIPIVDELGNQIDAGGAIIPLRELEIQDVWHTVSMRGTGSNNILAKNVFVPEHRVSSFSKAIDGNYPSLNLQSQSLYRSAFIPAAAIIFGGTSLGLARSAMEHFLEKLPSKRIMYTPYDRQDEAAITHFQVAEAEMKLETAQLLLNRAANDIDSWAKSGEYMEYKNRARVRMDTSYAVRNCYEAIEILITAGGGSSIAEGNPLNQIMSDIRSALVHALANPNTTLETYGRILCGKDANTHMI